MTLSIKKFCGYIATCIFLVTSTNSYSESFANNHLSVSKADITVQNSLNQDHLNKTATYQMSIGTETLNFDLEINEALFAAGSDTLESVESSDFQLYKGTIVGVNNSWARFTYSNGVMTGAYYNGQSLIMVLPFSEIKRSLSFKNAQQISTQAIDDAPTVAIDVADIEHDGLCALHDHDTVQSLDYDNFVSSIRESAGTQAVGATQEITISLFADTEFVSSNANATQEMLSHLNFADGVFTTQLNIQFVVGETLELTDNGTLTSTDPAALVTALRDTDFVNPGLRHLFTGKNLNGSTVGIAFLSSLCRASSAGVTQSFNGLTSLIFTHELGHNFGAPHDNQSGSACSSQPSGFLMNPSINAGGPTFSSCSVEQILPVIANAADLNRQDSCIVAVNNSVVEITSVPNETVTFGDEYAYDDDNTIDVLGEGVLDFNLDIGPEGMVVDQLGVVSWIPSGANIGTNFVQITVQNGTSSATQSFEIEVTSDFIVVENQLTTYIPSQDLSGGVVANLNPVSTELQGNTWKQLIGDFEITPSTILEFDFSSDNQGEIHGIGFDDDNGLSADRVFALHGTQTWGIRGFSYSQIGETQSFSIPIGQYYSGNFDRLVFVNDDDLGDGSANSVFSNIRLVEVSDEEEIPNIDFNSTLLAPFLPVEQDISGTVLIIENGAGVELIGNRWQRVDFGLVEITQNTVIEFEFKSGILGEIHGFGFLDEGAHDPRRTFKLLGTQRYGIEDFKYIGEGEYQTFVIPVGQYFIHAGANLVFIMDSDIGGFASESTFRNIKIYEEN